MAHTIGIRRAAPRWRTSLYARAALFLALGSGSLMGAGAVLLGVTVEDSVDQLLAERTLLARGAGAFVEQRVLIDLDHLGSQLRARLEEPPADRDAIRHMLTQEYPDTVFAEGVFVTDPEGVLLVGVPDAPDALEAVFARSGARGSRSAVAVSSQLPLGHRPVVLFVRRLETPSGRVIGYLGGLLQPASVNLLGALQLGEGAAPAGVHLVDRDGRVVASTRPGALLHSRDHDRILARAIESRSTLQGRCHSCHLDEGSRRDTDILAFAPLPTLDLGVAVVQPEVEALAPAFALRRRLLLLGSSFVALFLIFAGLSVRAVVLPVTRLTGAVRRVEGHRERISLGAHGRDELGELAVALESWRDRMIDSVRAQEAEARRLEQQRLYLQRVLRAQEDERGRVARELHDTVAQDLAAVRLEVERLRARRPDRESQESLEAVESRVAATLETVRRILLDLRLSVLETMGFVPALEWLMRRDPRLARLRGTLDADLESEDLDEEVALSGFRIVQEALNNIVIHAAAEQFFVTARREGREVVLTVEDDGRGFDVAATLAPPQSGRGLGLLGMAERARLVGGRLSILSEPGGGTTVIARLPARPRAEPQEESS